MDQRKGLAVRGINLLTGGRVTDISPAAQDRARNARLRAYAQQSGARVFETFYWPESLLEKMRATDPEAAEAAEKMNQFRNQQVRKAKLRKEKRTFTT